jgi:hypothetical protein
MPLRSARVAPVATRAIGISSLSATGGSSLLCRDRWKMAFPEPAPPRRSAGADYGSDGDADRRGEARRGNPSGLSAKAGFRLSYFHLEATRLWLNGKLSAPAGIHAQKVMFR